MALTATAQSALPRERTWDQVIVPTLRKRLEDESHALSKRMSAASMGSTDEIDSYGQSNIVYVSREKTTTPTSQPKPSAIPRPSLQHSRTETSSDSPMTTKSTRIPMSRARTGSTSSNQPSLNGHTTGLMTRSESRNGASKVNAESSSLDLWPVKELYPPSSVGSRSTVAMRTPRSQVSELMNESPPFNPNSVSSRRGFGVDNNSSFNSRPELTHVDPPRMSSDSEERPFEHWYRGDVSRNGGVGELRVARRQEMLDIANYGHTLRQASERLGGHSPRSRSNSRGRDTMISYGPNGRPRAGSLGARESIYLDEDEQARLADMVLDERPLTDLDSDEERDIDDYYQGQYDEDEGVDMAGDEDHEVYSHGHCQSMSTSDHRSETPTSSRHLASSMSKTGSSFQSRIPTPTPRTLNDPAPPRTPTPTSAQPLSRGTSEPLPSSSVTSSPRSRANSKAGLTSPPTTHRAKSPAASTRTVTSTGTVNTASKSKQRSPGTAKKPPPKKSPVSKKREEDSRRSVATYPAPDGEEDMVHAIPSWTKPVEGGGNWDDVVLPVVARKKGLDGHYEQVDGTPKPKPPGEPIYEPAPGTFGLDQSKYRPPRTNLQPEEIPMDEFGQRKEISAREEPQTLAPPSPVDLRPPESPAFGTRSRAESPAPFSRYLVDERNGNAIPDIQVAKPSMDLNTQLRVEQEVEEHSGGCCKCVIM
ncbi:hypothetical protein ABKN59_006949 [Abortiporus biennis]